MAIRVTPLLLGLVASTAAHSQEVLPSSVTPPTLVPARPDTGFQVNIPQAGALQAPAGADGMAVSLGEVRVEGGFAEVADQVQAVTAVLAGKRVSLAQIYWAAARIEEIHARAGYMLVRVSVPPQDLRDGGALRIVVTDGFIERVDASKLPARVRGAAMARAGQLEGLSHVTLEWIESPLMIAGDIPGLALRSTLMRGDRPGGAGLVLEGSHHLVSGSVGVDNVLSPALGRWGGNLQVSLNSVLGLGEQIYGFVASDYEINHIFDDQSHARVVGGGAIVPLGDGRLNLNPEVTFARTMPVPTPGAPASVGTLRRLSLRASDTLARTRWMQAGASLTVEHINETNELPSFAVMISHDRYMAARLGLSLAKARTNGNSLGGSVQFSKGLGDLGAISAAAASASGVGFSRAGSSTNFSKLALNAHARWRFGGILSYDIIARGQTGFGKPLVRAEQFAPEGADGLSAYVGGVTALDTGAVVRNELAVHVPLKDPAGLLSALAPYAFVAFGGGRLERPTAVEQGRISAFNLGAGVRVTLLGRLAVGVECARGISDTSALDKVNRVSATATLRF